MPHRFPLLAFLPDWSPSRKPAWGARLQTTHCCPWAQIQGLKDPATV